MTQSQFMPPMHPNGDLLFLPTYDSWKYSYTPPIQSTYPLFKFFIETHGTGAPTMGPEGAYADLNGPPSASPSQTPYVSAYSASSR